MKKLLFTLIITHVFFHVVFSQRKYSLLGEGKDKRVSLIWTVDRWDYLLDGVHIKRRTVLSEEKYSDWVLLTKTLLEQSNDLSKVLDNVSNEKNKVKQLTEKRALLFSNTNPSSTTITELTKSNLSAQLDNNNDALSMLNLMFTFDYDIAFMFGFGYEDYKLPRKGIVEYGLFTVVKGIESVSPEATYQYRISDIPDLNVQVIKEKIKRRRKNIQLSFLFSGEELDSKKTLAGFNVYKKINSGDFIKINKDVIWLSKDDEKRTLFYKDKIDDLDQKYTYSVVPVSIFNNEGEYHEISLDLGKEVAFQPPILSTSQHKNSDFINEGAKLQWDFNESVESEIKGFIIQRKSGSEIEYITVSDTLPVNARNYIDVSLNDALVKRYAYRVVVFPKESYPQWSNIQSFYYNPKPVVENEPKLNATPLLELNQSLVKLEWEASSSFIDKIAGFVVYCDRSGGILAREGDYSNIKNTEVTYKIEGGPGRVYQFAVKYENIDGEISNYTDTIQVTIPNPTLPNIKIWPFRVIDKRISIDWRYSDNIVDLKGFRIYLNDELFADENTINANLRTWNSEVLEPGKYTISIEAVSAFGVVSKRSGSLNVSID